MAKNFHSNGQANAVKKAAKLQKQLKGKTLTPEEKETIPPEVLDKANAKPQRGRKRTEQPKHETEDQQSTPRTASIEMPKAEIPKAKRIMSLRHDFSHEELASMSEQLVNCVEREKILTLEAKSSAASYRRQIKDAQGERDRLSTYIKDKYQMISVECTVEFDFKAGYKHIIDPRTKSVLTTEPITPEERQLRFPDEVSNG